MSNEIQRPVPEISPRMRPFWKAAAEGRLVVQRCDDCGKKHFPAIEICNGCLRNDLRWIDVSGRGTVFSFVVMHQVYHPAFAGHVPYVVADIELDEGPRIISNVIGCDLQDVEIGMTVIVEFQPPAGSATGPAMPMFRSAS
ncbi:MAG: Zn-ribbon domain-containing OB-fold protein [Candidatus Binatia bacterium]